MKNKKIFVCSHYSKILLFLLITNTFLHFIVPYRSLSFPYGTLHYVSGIRTCGRLYLCTVIGKVLYLMPVRYYT